MSKGKKKGIRRRRTKKVSQGINGATKTALTAVQKVLLGGGAARTFTIGQPNKESK